MKKRVIMKRRGGSKDNSEFNITKITAAQHITHHLYRHQDGAGEQ